MYVHVYNLCYSRLVITFSPYRLLQKFYRHFMKPDDKKGDDDSHKALVESPSKHGEAEMVPDTDSDEQSERPPYLTIFKQVRCQRAIVFQPCEKFGE